VAVPGKGIVMRGQFGVCGRGTMLLLLSSAAWVLVVTHKPLHSGRALALAMAEMRSLQGMDVVPPDKALQSRRPLLAACIVHLAAGLALP